MMIDIANSPLFLVFAVVLILETLKTLGLGTATALRRQKTSRYINPEDAKWLGGEAVEVDHPDAARMFRAQRNNLENLVPFSLLGILYIIIGANLYAGIVYFTLFFMGRIAHTYAYLSEKPKFRRDAYSLGWLSCVLMSIHILIALASQML